MRGNRQNGGKPSHIVSAWSKEDGFCVGQKAVEEKTNEIAAIPELLERLRINGQIVTIDAMGTQKEIAQKIRAKRADYALAVKGNQGTFHREIVEYFEDEGLREKIKEEGGYKRTREKAHGQIETREYYQTEDIKWLSQKKDWKGIKSIAMERKTLTKGGRSRTERRYFISSLPQDIETLGRAVRGHWSVESMHWYLDVTISGRRKHNNRQNSGAEPQYHQEMVSQYTKNRGIVNKDETSVNEKETLCDQFTAN